MWVSIGIGVGRVVKCYWSKLATRLFIDERLDETCFANFWIAKNYCVENGSSGVGTVGVIERLGEWEDRW